MDFDLTGATYLPVLMAVGIAGIVIDAARGRYVLALWVLFTLLITPSGAPTYAMVPWSMLVAVAAGALLTSAPRRALPIAGVIVVVASFSAYLAPLAESSPMHAIGADELGAMEWIASETDPAATVLVVPGTGWGRDMSNEWLPAITGRHSLLTVQGYEWTTRATWEGRVADHEAALECSRQTVSCLEPWLGETDYIFLPKGPRLGPRSPQECCPALRDSLLADPRLTIVHDGPGATIALVTGP